jgi:hypothetical protein
MKPAIASFLTERRRFAVAIVAVAALVFAASVMVAEKHRREAVLGIELVQARKELAAMTRERDVKALQLAPFETLAAVQVGSAPYEQRLALLLERLQALAGAGAEAKGRRHLDAAALEEIRTALQDVPDIDVEVGGVASDPESMALAQELHSVFDKARFKTRRIAEYVRPPNGFHGVSIYSKHELDQVLAGAISRIFKELSQPMVQWVDEENIAAARAGEPPPDLKIIVGSQ